LSGCPGLVLEYGLVTSLSFRDLKPRLIGDAAALNPEPLRAEAGHLPKTKSLIGVFFHLSTCDHASFFSSGCGLGHCQCQPSLERARSIDPISSAIITAQV
jgi:hypothetical protein